MKKALLLMLILLTLGFAATPAFAQEPCNPISVLPFTENFEGEPVNGYVPCWTRSTDDTTGAHYVYQNVDEVWAWGSKALDFGYTPGCYTQAVLPIFAVTIPLNTLKVEFDARRGSTEGAFLFGAMTNPDDDATFVVIDTIFTTCNGAYYECGWEHITIYCDNYTGNGHFLAFRADNCGNSPRLIDNLVIDVLPACLPVFNVTVSNPTLGGATITWSGSADSYNVYVGDHVYSTTDTFVVISDLNASSSYTATVRAYCATDSSELSAPVILNTACGAITVTADNPWFENFENYSGGGAQPFVCWDAIVQPNGPFVYCGYSASCHSGENSAEFKGYINMLALPIFSNNISELRLSFWATATNVTEGNVEVGYMTDITDTSTFVFVADAGTPGPRGTLGSMGNGNFMGAFDFDSLTIPNGARIVLRYTNPSPSASWNLDDFTVSLVPDCPSPAKTSVQASNIDGHSATISFTDNNPDHNSWTVYYRDHNAASSAPWNSEITTTTSVTLTGLAPLTTYDVYVVTNCATPAAEVDATLTIQFTTPVSCPAPENVTVSNVSMTGATVTWSSNASSFYIEYGVQGFEMGTGTTAIVTTNSYDLTGLTAGTIYTVFVSADCGADGASGPAFVNFNTILCDSAEQCAYTFTLTDSYGDGWNQGYLTVKQNGIPVTTLTLPTGSNAVETVYLCDNALTSLEWTSGGYAYEAGFSVAGPGNVELYSIVGMYDYNTFSFTTNCTTPTCLKPTSIEVTNIGSTSADVSWVVASTETAWNLEYKVASDSTWTVVPMTTNSYSLTNLSAYTHYDVRVQADCGGGDLSDYKATSFTTDCDVITTFPFEEDFESASLGCWSQEVLEGNNPWTIYMYDSYSGTYSVHMSYTNNTSSRLISPIFDLTNLTIPMVSYYYSLPDYFGAVDSLAVYYRSSLSDDWVRVTGYSQMTLSFEIDSFALPNPSATYQISFVGYGIDGNSILLDDIRVYDAAGPAPIVEPTATTLPATDVAQTTATLNGIISNPDNVTIIEQGFEWKQASASSYIIMNVTGNTMAAPLVGLTANTTYTYRAFVITANGTHYGSDETFTTLEEQVDPCDAPENLHAAAFGSDYITLGWNANANVSNWNVRYRPQGGTWTSATANTNSYNIVGLTPETTYEIEVQANCGDGAVSEWSSTVTVTTTVGIESWLESSVNLYPNPAKEYVDIRVDGNVNVTSMEVYDVYGKLINAMNVVETPTRINVSNLANGMYFVRVNTEAGMVTKTFVKK